METSSEEDQIINKTAIVGLEHILGEFKAGRMIGFSMVAYSENYDVVIAMEMTGIPAPLVLGATEILKAKQVDMLLMREEEVKKRSMLMAGAAQGGKH